MIKLQLERLTYTEAGVLFRKELEQSLSQINDRIEEYVKQNFDLTKLEDNQSKQKFIYQSSETTQHTPRYYLQTLRQEIVNTKGNQKLVEILLPDIQKNKSLLASLSQTSGNSPRFSQFILKKVNDVKSVANEEDKLIKKMESISLKLQNSQLRSGRRQLDKSNLNSPSIQSSPRNILGKQQKMFNNYQENQNLNKTNRKYFNLQNEMESKDGNGMINNLKRSQTNRNMIDQVEIDDQSKLFYMSQKLDKIYQKHNIIQVNQEAIKNNISSKYSKMSQIASFDKNTFDHNPFKKQFDAYLFAISKEFQEEEERKKQTLVQLHKNKYIKFWKGQQLLINSKIVDQPAKNIHNKLNKQNLNLSPIEQAEIQNMKMLFNSRA